MHRFTATVGTANHTVTVEERAEQILFAEIDGKRRDVAIFPLDSGRYLVKEGETVRVLSVTQLPDGAWSVLQPESVTTVNLATEEECARSALKNIQSAGNGSNAVRAPMPGKVVKCLVAVGQDVDVGQSVVVVEAMKMENELKTTLSGKIKRINVTEGASVEAGTELLVVEPETPSA